MDSKILLIALGCGRLPGLLTIAANFGLVVFGTMDERASAKLTAFAAHHQTSPVPVYFYETG